MLGLFLLIDNLQGFHWKLTL